MTVSLKEVHRAKTIHERGVENKKEGTPTGLASLAVSSEKCAITHSFQAKHRTCQLGRVSGLARPSSTSSR